MKIEDKRKKEESTTLEKVNCGNCFQFFFEPNSFYLKIDDGYVDLISGELFDDDNNYGACVKIVEATLFIS